MQLCHVFFKVFFWLETVHPFLPCVVQTMLWKDVCPSHASILSKWLNIHKLFSVLGSYANLVFPHQTVWQYSDGHPERRASNARGYEIIPIFDHCLAISETIQDTTIVTMKFE